jgi:hypothetical protein
MSAERPAFYAARRGRAGDWWTVLHPPYTAWHLSYVVVGACLAPEVGLTTLAGTLLAFFLAVGVAAHALDELHGRPLGTAIPSPALVGAAALGLGGAVALGVVGVQRVGAPLGAFVAVGVALVLGYDLELVGGRVHTDLGFALAWGAFPVLTAYYAEARSLGVAALVAALFATALSMAQRRLSNRARFLRRRVEVVRGVAVLRDGRVERLDREALLAPVEAALRALSVAAVAIAVAVALVRLG